MNNIADWSSSLLHAFTVGMSRFMAGIPTFLGALLIIIVGWIIAALAARLTARFLRAVHLDALAERIRVNEFLRQAGTRLKASDIFGQIVKWVMLLVFVQMAADQLGLVQITAVINEVLFFIPNILVALLVLGVGAFLAQLLAGVVRGTAAEAGWRSPDALAKVAYGAVMAFAIIAAMNQLNISPIVVNTLYIGLVAAISLALGLAFGLGGRETAARLTERWVGQVEERATLMPPNDSTPATQSPHPIGARHDGPDRETVRATGRE